MKCHHFEIQQNEEGVRSRAKYQNIIPISHIACIGFISLFIFYLNKFYFLVIAKCVSTCTNNLAPQQ